MANCTEADHVLFLNDKTQINRSRKNFYKQWWYQEYEHQHFLSEIIQRNIFYKITIILLLFDFIFVLGQTIIDFTKVKSEFLQNENSLIKKSKSEIEILMKTFHYLSLSILTFFLLEFFMKIYIYGKDFWNINKRKMEYFDGFIVILSYFIDIYFLLNENNYFMEYRFEMLTTIRVWRVIRLINGVVQCVINEEQKKKDQLNEQYIITLELFLDLLKIKTTSAQNEYKSLKEYFQQIDHQCEEYLNSYKQTSHEMTLSNAITQLSEQLHILIENIH